MNMYGGYQDNPLLAELYDLVPMYLSRPDVDFYRNLCRETKGNILELGCGTGRILIPAAEAGGHITGLDISGNMISRCREKIRRSTGEVQSRIRLVEANMIDFKLSESFSLATAPFRGFQHLIRVNDQLACLNNINHHLEMGGRLVFDVFQVNFEIISNPDRINEIEDTPEFELGDGRRLRCASRISLVHRSEQFSDVELIYYLTGSDGHLTRAVQAFPIRYFFRYEIEHLLARCGFEVVDLFGKFDKSPLMDDSPEMIFVCKKCREAK